LNSLSQRGEALSLAQVLWWRGDAAQTRKYAEEARPASRWRYFNTTPTPELSERARRDRSEIQSKVPKKGVLERETRVEPAKSTLTRGLRKPGRNLTALDKRLTG
jgi:hypothetical protein